MAAASASCADLRILFRTGSKQTLNNVTRYPRRHSTPPATSEAVSRHGYVPENIRVGQTNIRKERTVSSSSRVSSRILRYIPKSFLPPPLPPTTPTRPRPTASFKSWSMSEARTGPIIGGTLAVLILIFASVVIFYLAQRRWKQTRPQRDPERPLGGSKDKRPSAENVLVDRWSVAHTIVDNTDERRRDSNRPDPSPISKQEEPQRLLSPFTAMFYSPTTSTLSLQAPKPTVSATSNAETQSISAPTLVVAVQSPQCSATIP